MKDSCFPAPTPEGPGQKMRRVKSPLQPNRTSAMHDRAKTKTLATKLSFPQVRLLNACPHQQHRIRPPTAIPEVTRCLQYQLETKQYRAPSGPDVRVFEPLTTTRAKHSNETNETKRKTEVSMTTYMTRSPLQLLSNTHMMNDSPQGTRRTSARLADKEDTVQVNGTIQPVEKIKGARSNGATTKQGKAEISGNGTGPAGTRGKRKPGVYMYTLRMQTARISCVALEFRELQLDSGEELIEQMANI